MKKIDTDRTVIRFCLFLILLAFLISGCKKEVEEPVSISFNEKMIVGIKTIEYHGVVYDPNLLGYAFGLIPIYKGLPDLTAESYGFVCNRWIEVGQPITDILVNIENRTEGMFLCMNTTFEYTEVVIGDSVFDTSFNEDDCNNAIIKKEGQEYISLNYTKKNCKRME